MTMTSSPFRHKHKRSFLFLVLLFLVSVYFTTDAYSRKPPQEITHPGEGGGGTFPSPIIRQPNYGEPLPSLTPEELDRFNKGKEAFGKTFNISNGAGPIANASPQSESKCTACHNNPVIGGNDIQNHTDVVFRFGKNVSGVFDPMENQGGSLRQAIASNPACQEVVPADAYMIKRTALGLFGFGLVESIDDSVLKQKEISPPPGISGRAHMIRALEDPPEAALHVGRFGWKAQMPTLLSFAGDAALQEMGITNEFFLTDNHPNVAYGIIRPECDDGVADPEAPDIEGVNYIRRLADFMRFLAPPPQTPRSGMTGEQVFKNIGCAACHVPSFETSWSTNIPSSLRGKTIKAYSDFLLHDMGSAADQIGQGDASMTEMRTPPLMGFITRNNKVSHAGAINVNNIAAIIDLHNAPGSEAQTSAANYFLLSQAHKDALQAFLMSLGRPEFDLDSTLNIDFGDFIKFRDCFNGSQNYSPDTECAIGDINQDWRVNLTDANYLLQAYHPPLDDCQCNGNPDLIEILQGTAPDASPRDAIVDNCGVKLNVFIIGATVIDPTHIRLSGRIWGAQPGDTIQFFYNFEGQGTGMPYGAAYCINLKNQISLGTVIANSSGGADLNNITVPMPLGAKKVFMQAGAFRSGTNAIKSAVTSTDINQNP